MQFKDGDGGGVMGGDKSNVQYKVLNALMGNMQGIEIIDSSMSFEEENCG